MSLFAELMYVQDSTSLARFHAPALRHGLSERLLSELVGIGFASDGGVFGLKRSSREAGSFLQPGFGPRGGAV